MKSTEEKIEVMQAFLQGKRIRVSQKGKGEWTRYAIGIEPNWDWKKYDYKVEEEPQYVPFDFSDDLLGMKIRYKGISKNFIIIQYEKFVIITGISNKVT